MRTARPSVKTSTQSRSTRAEAVEAWMQLGRALATSADKADRDLARSIASFIQEVPATPVPTGPTRMHEKAPMSKVIDVDPSR